MCIHRGLAKLWISTDPRAVCALFNGPVKLFKMLPICSLDHRSQITSSQRGINSAVASIRPADMTQHSCYSRSMNASHAASAERSVMVTYSCGFYEISKKLATTNSEVKQTRKALIGRKSVVPLHLERALFKVCTVEESPLYNVTQHWVILRRLVGTIAPFLSKLCLCVGGSRPDYTISILS